MSLVHGYAGPAPDVVFSELTLVRISARCERRNVEHSALDLETYVPKITYFIWVL